jgi:hypothetical protein
VADFTVTIANSLNVFGPAPSNKWNAWAWNAFRWGEGTADLAVSVGKVIGNSLALSDSATPVTAFFVNVSATLTLASDMGSERLTDAAGYAYVFPSDTTEAENRDIPDWSTSTAATPTWSSATAGGTSWS